MTVDKQLCQSILKLAVKSRFFNSGRINLVFLGNHLKLIREAKYLSQSELAKKMSYDKSYISHMENGTRTISSSALQEFKKALDIDGTPLTDDEKEQFIRELNSWADLYSVRDIDTASVRMQDCAKRVKWSFDPYLTTQYELTCAWHYSVIGEFESFDELMAQLSEKEPSFNDEQRFKYYHMVGRRELSLLRFKPSLVALFKTETLGKQLALAGNHYYEILYYQIAYCLTEMDYANMKKLSVFMICHLSISRKDETAYSICSTKRKHCLPAKGLMNSKAAWKKDLRNMESLR